MPLRNHEVTAPDDGCRRVLLKLSGEVFGGGEVSISTEVVRSIANVAATVGEVETSIVIGGGNFFRGAELSGGHGPLPCRLRVCSAP